MFSLCLERGRYIRVRGKTLKRDIEREFSFPVNADIFSGAIIAVVPQPRSYCYARPYDSYETVALRMGADGEELKKLNGNSPLYPTKKVWLP